jgi:hypothetical protein
MLFEPIQEITDVGIRLQRRDVLIGHLLLLMPVLSYHFGGVDLREGRLVLLVLGGVGQSIGDLVVHLGRLLF